MWSERDLQQADADLLKIYLERLEIIMKEFHKTLLGNTVEVRSGYLPNTSPYCRRNVSLRGGFDGEWRGRRLVLNVGTQAVYARLCTGSLIH
jgi:hypothetical protein